MNHKKFHEITNRVYLAWYIPATSYMHSSACGNLACEEVEALIHGPSSFAGMLCSCGCIRSPDRAVLCSAGHLHSLLKSLFHQREINIISIKLRVGFPPTNKVRIVIICYFCSILSFSLHTTVLYHFSANGRFVRDEFLSR